MAETRQPTPAERRRQGLRRTAARAGAGARFVLKVVRLVRAILWRLAQVFLAIIIVFEEWGWRPLAAALARLAHLQSVAALEALIIRLPPYPALAVFALPSLLLLPLKLVALWLIGTGHVIAASALFIGAKIAGTAVVARLFHLTQPALMQLGWFARLYNVVMPWKEAMVAQVRASWAWRYGRVVKARLGQMVGSALARWRPYIESVVRRVRSLIGR